MRKTAGLLIAGLVALSLAGCGPYAPRSLPIVWSGDDVVGTWLHDVEDTSTGATLEFRTNGTFAYEGIPAEVATSGFSSGCNDAIAASSNLVTGEGVWEWKDGQYFVDFSDDLPFTWLYPAGFLNFDTVEFTCDVDHAGSYQLHRQP
jgi:hypothetical protein